MCTKIAFRLFGETRAPPSRGLAVVHHRAGENDEGLNCSIVMPVKFRIVP
jgi:hypothetical protein